MPANSADIMASSKVRGKTLTETTLYEKSKSVIIPDARLYDEIVDGITFIIAHDPNSFDFIKDTIIQIAKVDRTPTTPALNIYFINSNKDEIFLLDVEVDTEDEKIL